MSLMGKKTVDQIVRTLDKAQRELLELATKLSADATDKRTKAAEIVAAADADQHEADRARRVAERVQALVA